MNDDRQVAVLKRRERERRWKQSLSAHIRRLYRYAHQRLDEQNIKNPVGPEQSLGPSQKVKESCSINSSIAFRRRNAVRSYCALKLTKSLKSYRNPAEGPLRRPTRRIGSSLGAFTYW